MKASAKKFLSLFLTFALIAVTSVTCLYPVLGTEPENLLLNSGFESWDGAAFENWSIWRGNNGNTLLTQVAGRTGNAAKITVDNNNNTVNFYQTVTVDPAKTYILSAWVKTENIALQWSAAPGVYLSLSYNNNQQFATPIASEHITADCDWKLLEFEITPDAVTGSEWAINFDLAAEYLTGDIYIDDVCLKEKVTTPPPAADPDEMLLNNGFETWDGSAFEGWSIWRGNNGNTLLTQVAGRTGNAAKITVDNNNNTVNLYQTVTVDPTKTYILSAWVKTENLALQWSAAPGVYLSLSYNNNQQFATPVSSAHITESADWQELKIEITPDMLTGSEWAINFDLVAEYLTADIFVDDVSLKVKEQTPTPPPAADPDEILGNFGFETWDGTAFENWAIWRGNNGNTQLTQVNGRTGKAAKVTVDNNNNTVNLYQTVTLDPAKTYILSAWVKTENLALQWASAPGVYLSLSYNNNQQFATPVTSAHITENSDWVKLEFEVSPSMLTGSEWAVNFDLVAEYLTADIYIDDASLKEKETSTPNPGGGTEPDPGENPDPNPGGGEEPDPGENPEPDDGIIKNKGFENVSGGNFTNWSLWKGSHGQTTLSEAAGRTGKAAKLTIGNNGGIVNFYQVIELDPAKTYVFSAWVKTENLALQWDGAEGVYLSLSYNNNLPIARSPRIKANSDWQKLELTVSGSALTGDEWAVNFDLGAEFLTGDIYIDDVDIVEKVADPENPEPTPPAFEEERGALLQNRGFEFFTDGAFNRWTLWKGNKGNTQIAQVADGRTGKAAKITVDNNQNIVNLYQEIELDPTKEYTFSAWVKTENIELQWPGAQGVYIDLSCNNTKILASEAINSDSGWTKLEVVVNGGVLNGDEWSVRFDIAAEYLTGDVYIDDVAIAVTGTATEIAKPDEDELLKNNSFEIYSAGNFANWTTWKGNKGNTKFEQVDGRTGKAAKITVDNNNNIVNLYQELKIESDKEYTFSIWVKTEDIALQWPGAQGVYLNFKYNNKVVLMSKPVTVSSDWQKLELVVNGGILKGDEWGVSLDLAAEFLTGTIYVDDASVKVTGKGTPTPEQEKDELLENCGFELFSGYNFARWGLNRGNNGNTQLSQVAGRTGKAAKITVDDNNNIVALYQNIEIDPTKEYTFSAWVKLENIALQWEGAEGVYLAFGYNNTTPVRSMSLKADTGRWQKLEVTVNGADLKGDEWDVRFALTAEFLTGDIYVDDASMKITGVAKPKATTFLQNGSFDTADDDTIIKGWTAFSEDLFSVLERDTVKVKDGFASAKIFNTDEKIVSYWEQRIENLDVTKKYFLSGYIFSDMIVSTANGAAAFVEFYDAEGNLIRTVRSDYVTGEQADWTPFALVLEFPENCVTMVVKAGLIKAVGTAYFDGFSLVEYVEGAHEGTEGTKENIYALAEAEDEDYSDFFATDADASPATVWVIVAVAAAAVLLAAGAVTFILIKKKKATVK